MTFHEPILHHIKVEGVPLPDNPSQDDPNFWFNYSLESTEDTLRLGGKICFMNQGIALVIVKFLPDAGTHRRLEAHVHQLVHINTRPELRQRIANGIRYHAYCLPYACSAQEIGCPGNVLIAA